MKKILALLLSLSLIFSVQTIVLADPVLDEVDLTDGLPTTAFSASSYYQKVESYPLKGAFDNVWDTSQTPGKSFWTIEPGGRNEWIQVDFGKGQRVTKLKYQADGFEDYIYGFKNFIIQASDDQLNWKELYKGEALSNGEKQVFTWDNTDEYRYWRIYMIDNFHPTGGYGFGVSEIELINAKIEPPTYPKPSKDRAILVVTMTTGLEKEFDLSVQEVNSFIDWYEAKQAGSGKASYAINKHDNNKGPFKSRKDYILFDRVLTFEVSEY